MLLVRRPGVSMQYEDFEKKVNQIFVACYAKKKEKTSMGHGEREDVHKGKFLLLFCC